MYHVQRTENAHAGRVPEWCWETSSSHRKAENAARAARTLSRDASPQPGAWCYNVRVVDDAGTHYAVEIDGEGEPYLANIKTGKRLPGRPRQNRNVTRLDIQLDADVAAALEAERMRTGEHYHQIVRALVVAAWPERFASERPFQ